MTKVTQRGNKEEKKKNCWKCEERKTGGKHKMELEGASERGIKAERNSEKEDRVQEKLRLRGQGQENKNISRFFSGS